MRRLSTGEAGAAENQATAMMMEGFQRTCMRPRRRANARMVMFLWGSIGMGLASFLSLHGCAGTLSMEEQKRLVQKGEFRGPSLTVQAFVEVWGDPPYVHKEFMQFFSMKDGTLVPFSRVPVGQAPPDWETGLAARDALFLAYPERGWYLVFVEEGLVYHERLPARELYVIGKAWARDDQFKTSLEKPVVPQR